jgi:hypothetical protein
MRLSLQDIDQVQGNLTRDGVDGQSRSTQRLSRIVEPRPLDELYRAAIRIMVWISSHPYVAAGCNGNTSSSSPFPSADPKPRLRGV